LHFVGVSYYLIESEDITGNTDKQIILLENIFIKIYRYAQAALDTPHHQGSIKSEREVDAALRLVELHIYDTEVIIYADLFKILENLSETRYIYIA
jgi:hypothetical protein